LIQCVGATIITTITTHNVGTLLVIIIGKSYFLFSSFKLQTVISCFLKKLGDDGVLGRGGTQSRIESSEELHILSTSKASATYETED
jgi:hypothetical protein